MSLKKFEKNDIFKNVLKTTPEFKFKIYVGERYLNNSLDGYARLNGLKVESVPDAVVGCGDNSFDLSCEENSYNIALI
jgi:hypothetical protein